MNKYVKVSLTDPSKTNIEILNPDTLEMTNITPETLKGGKSVFFSFSLDISIYPDYYSDEWQSDFGWYSPMHFKANEFKMKPGEDGKMKYIILGTPESKLPETCLCRRLEKRGLVKITPSLSLIGESVEGLVDVEIPAGIWAHKISVDKAKLMYWNESGREVADFEITE